MVTGIRMLLTTVLFCLSVMQQAASAAPLSTRADVLLLLSYEPAYPAAQTIVHTVRDAFAANAGVNLHVEFMDADFYSTEEYMQAYRHLLAIKHEVSGNSYDAVIAAGNNALRLMADSQQEFNNPPVVFIGVSDADLIRRVRKEGNFTGLPEALPVYEFISFLRYLYPGFNSIHAITDGIPGREYRLEKLQLATRSLNIPLTIHSLENLSWQQLADILSNIKDQPILLLSAREDVEKQKLPFKSAIRQITSSAASPVWHLWQQGIGDGLAGGVFSDLKINSERAVLLVMDILHGKRADDIPTEWQNGYSTVVDLAVAEKYGLSVFDFPAQVTFLNNHSAFYEEHRNGIIAGFIILLIVIVLLLMFSLEIRRRRLSDEQLEYRTELMRDILDSVPDLMFYKDIQGRYILSNRRFNEFFGCDPAGKTDYDIFDKDTAEFFVQRDREAQTRKNGVTTEGWVHGADGSVILMETNKTPIFDRNGQMVGVFGLSRDITELKKAQENLEHLAHHDTLTGLPNRLLLNKKLEYALQISRRSGESLAVIFLDLDRFKDINDTIGHDVGDLLLTDVAQRLNKNVRDSDICARLGGDEFVVVLTQVESPEKIKEKCEQLLHVISRHYSLQGHMLSVFASAGISIYPEHGSRVEELIRNADAALHKAKELGRNRYCYYRRELTDTIHSRMSLEQDLRAALQNHEFQLLFQPQFYVGEETPRRVEALLRWPHPARGVISPLDFIPLAETSGMISELGYWVVESACQQFMFWREQGLILDKIAVNVSAIQINASFANTIAGIMAHLSFRPEWLELEVTESLMMSGTTEVNQQIQMLRELGVEFAIDDFGTGYSSLSKIKSMPVTVLKIDQSFVRDINDDINDYEIVRAIVLMARSLGLTVVAEGVERAEQEQTLHRIGCEWVQGYFYARPMDGGSFYRQYAVH